MTDAFIPPTPEQADAVAWAFLREERDRRLIACDWTQLADTGITNEAERQLWADYRTALRELPEHTADPTAPVWPEPPAPLTL